MSGGSLQEKRTRFFLNGVTGILIFSIVVGIIYLCYEKGQQRRGKREQVSALPDSVCLSGGNSYTDQGMLYFNDHFIRFANAETGTDNVICTDANCRHEDSRNSECGAYLGEGACSGLVQRGERIYYLAQDDKMEKQILYSANLQGKDRTKIAELVEMNNIVDVIYHDQMVLISYVNVDYEGGESDSCGIYGYDLEKKEGKLYYQREGNGFIINSLSLQKDVLYFSYHGSDVTKEEIRSHSEDEAFEAEHSETVVKGLRLSDGKETVSIEGYGSNCVLPYCFGKVFFTKGDSNYYYDEQSKKSEKFSEENLLPVYSLVEGNVFYIASSETGKYRYLQYNPKQLKMETLGEGDLYPVAILEKKTYVLFEDGEYGVLDTQDFLQGRYSECIHF